MNSKFERGIEIVGNVIIENKEEKILITFSHKWNNKWMLPGGHVESGETVLEGLVREGEEETGLKLKGTQVFHWGELINSKDFHREAHFIYFDVYATAISKEVKLDGVELTDFKWLFPEEALKIDLAGTSRLVIEKFIEFKKNLQK